MAAHTLLRASGAGRPNVIFLSYDYKTFSVNNRSRYNLRFSNEELLHINLVNEQEQSLTASVMPKPFVPSATANATTITRRVASSIKTQYHHSSTTQTSNSRRHALNNTHQCRCQCRHFSQLTPKPLARLHDRREVDAIFFSRSSSTTLHSSNKRQKDERSKNRVAVETGQTVRYDLPPGTEGVGGGDHKPPDERVVRLGKSTSFVTLYLQKGVYTNGL